MTGAITTIEMSTNEETRLVELETVVEQGKVLRRPTYAELRRRRGESR